MATTTLYFFSSSFSVPSFFPWPGIQHLHSGHHGRLGEYKMEAWFGFEFKDI